MICKYCNAENKDYAVFCEQCGKALNDRDDANAGNGGLSGDGNQPGYGADGQGNYGSAGAGYDAGGQGNYGSAGQGYDAGSQGNYGSAGQGYGPGVQGNYGTQPGYGAQGGYSGQPYGMNGYGNQGGGSGQPGYGMNGYWNYPQPENKGQSIASLVLGCIGLVAWCIPLFGYPVTIVGLILGVTGRNKGGKNLAVAGIILCTITLVLTLINSIAGAYMGLTGQLY